MDSVFFYPALYAGNVIFFGVFTIIMTRMSHAEGAGGLLQVGHILEFAVYNAAVIRLCQFVFQGLQGGAEQGVALLRPLEIFFIEALLLPAFLVKRPKAPAPDIEKEAREELLPPFSLYLIGLLLLLILALLLWAFPGAPAFLQMFSVAAVLAVLALLHMLWQRQLDGVLRRIGQGSRLLQNQREADYMRSVDRQYQRTRELWHDLKNHISVLQILAQERKYGELTEYLAGFRQDVERQMLPYRTGNSAVDALLGDKLYRIQKKGIAVSLKLCPLGELRIPPQDFCVILGNLLDNAMEACAELKEARIALSLKLQEGFYYLNITNTAKELEKKEARFVSRKMGMENGVGHGLGLRSVERLVHQYGGSMTAEYRDGKFMVILRVENRECE